jgi:hypothetical protein
MIKIKLSKNEYLYLCQNSFFSKNNKIVYNSIRNKEDFFILKCTEDLADEIRDKCSERLQLVGFDENYELTNEG